MGIEHDIVDAVKDHFKHHGWKKKHHSWMKNYGEVIVLFKIQKGFFHPNFQLIWGVYLQAFGEKKHVVDADCHIRGHFNKTIGLDVLNFHNKSKIQEAQQIAAIKKFCEEEVIPALEKFSSIEKIRKERPHVNGSEIKKFLGY